MILKKILLYSRYLTRFVVVYIIEGEVFNSTFDQSLSRRGCDKNGKFAFIVHGLREDINDLIRNLRYCHKKIVCFITLKIQLKLLFFEYRKLMVGEWFCTNSCLITLEHFLKSINTITLRPREATFRFCVLSLNFVLFELRRFSGPYLNYYPVPTCLQNHHWFSLSVS